MISDWQLINGQTKAPYSYSCCKNHEYITFIDTPSSYKIKNLVTGLEYQQDQVGSFTQFHYDDGDKSLTFLEVTVLYLPPAN